MKKHETSSLQSSSYRQENSSNDLQSKSIGCMSGIFHLIYKYNNNRRGKFITSGNKKQGNNVNVVASSSNRKKESGDNNNFTRLTRDLPRRPTPPAEIRQGKAERGLFLEEAAAAEKRRELIEALEKCDEDLKELKKIIDVVKSTVSVSVDNPYDDDDNKTNGDLQPSPVSVLNGFTALSSPSVLISSSSSYPRRYANGGGAVVQQQRQQKQKKKPGEESFIMNMMSNMCLVEEVMKREGIIRSCKKMGNNVIMRTAVIISPSKAMIDSVNEVCRDVVWGERREIERIGSAVHDYIFRDLIDEFAKELGSFCMYSLPFEACRRSLRF